MAEKYRLSAHSLWPAICRVSESALADGALHSIETHSCFIEQGGMRFMLRIAKNLQRKQQEQQRVHDHEAADFDPFLPPESALTVAELSDTHLAVLNKFNVLEHHLLIITRDFEDQERLLSHADFEALCLAMGEYEALGFYNGGEQAGASQRHKHLQMIPLPLTDEGEALPLEALLGKGEPQAGIHTLNTLAFGHRLLHLEAGLFEEPARAAAQCHAHYLAMLESLGLAPLQREGLLWQGAPYNLLLTRRWMMLVPRRCEHFGSISINAMAFAGSLFVRDAQELEQVREAGPMNMLAAVS